MLLKLNVRNYALIRELDLEPDKGLTIVTGETGAGKSILLGALSLVLGARADSAVLLDKEDKCIVEGTFRVESYDLEEFFNVNNIDYDPLTTVRREISPAGKSRAFVNDTPVTLNVVKELGDRLIDIHSQHQTLMLHDNSFQLGVIDSFAGNDSLREEYRRCYSAYRKLGRELEDIREKAEKNRADLEYYKFQLSQLEEAGLKIGEQSELESEQEILSHSEEIKTALTRSSELFSAEGHSILSMLREVRSNLARIRSFLPQGESMLARTESSLIELDDLMSEIDRLSSSVDADPGRLAYVNARLDTLYALIQKHRVKDLDALLEKREEIRIIVGSINSGDERLRELEKLHQVEHDKLLALSTQISGKRKAVIPETERQVTELLRQLGMPNARFAIEMKNSGDFTPSGTDQADFLFSANRQVPPDNLSRIASGGELSRVMLSLKSLITRNNNLPTIIFDEIDSGVSGEVADKVGQILSSMGRYMQVINITHLPQVASRGSRHYHVYKSDTEDSTITRVRLLSDDERVMEVARLLSGSEVTGIAVENARELLKSASN
ncbi:MAG: DNA repair protein RecN [Bacteroidales bacterium]|jgi:DNA repair protein RecN (Recombination protein N)|nr:DNA repair protein RecN [Bacteroidales bacterium]